MAGFMKMRIWDVEHGACAMVQHSDVDRLAMIDSGHNVSENWRPSKYIKNELGKSELDYLIVTNADHDHLSDLEGLWEEEINVKVLFRNKAVPPNALRQIKMRDAGGKNLSNDIERFLAIHETYNSAVTEPFDTSMGGITIKTFHNSYPEFQKTNDLSLVVFVRFGAFKALFPGDMEKAGWQALLKQPAFVQELNGTSVLLASHHGRDSGYCAEIFQHFSPELVVFSDKPIKHETQQGMAGTYGYWSEPGKYVENLRDMRRVLTTRSDGWIHINASDTDWAVWTENENG